MIMGIASLLVAKLCIYPHLRLIQAIPIHLRRSRPRVWFRMRATRGMVGTSAHTVSIPLCPLQFSHNYLARGSWTMEATHPIAAFIPIQTNIPILVGIRRNILTTPVILSWDRDMTSLLVFKFLSNSSSNLRLRRCLFRSNIASTITSHIIIIDNAEIIKL